jgi:hypothetical protein
MQKEPQTPTLNAQIKTHKPGNPIRPVINNIHAPACKISKHLAKKLHEYLNLDYLFNVKNSITLAEDLSKLTTNENHRMINYDIKDLYVNIPIADTLTITKSMLNKHNDSQITRQLLRLLDVILHQNYLAFQNQIYKPEKGVSMGSPISNIVAEIFLQHFETILMKQLLDTQNVIYYTRYVDDILLIYDSKRITPETIHNFINQIHPNLQFNPTHEHNNNISFLDLLITRHSSNLEIDIYRKHTTDTTINFHSNHPTEQKLAAYHYYINRMLSLPLTEEKRQAEWETIKTIARNNNYPIKCIIKLKTQMQNKTPTPDASDNNKTWASFTYHSSNVRKITNLFRQTNVNITFRSANTIRQYTRPNTAVKIHDYNSSGVYKLTCMSCNKSYIGQTSRNLAQRYREHIRYIRNNDPQFAYAMHILQNTHEYGTITDTMTLLRPIQKTSLLIPYEQFFIQSFYHEDNLIPEQGPGEQNPLFNLAFHTNTTSHPLQNRSIPP